jgi:hypothetical protein
VYFATLQSEAGLLKQSPNNRRLQHQKLNQEIITVFFNEVDRIDRKNVAVSDGRVKNKKAEDTFPLKTVEAVRSLSDHEMLIWHQE